MLLLVTVCLHLAQIVRNEIRVLVFVKPQTEAPFLRVVIYIVLLFR